MDPTELQCYLNMQAGLDLERRDPLRTFKWASKQQAKLMLFLAKFLEVLARFGNSAGKTSGVAAAFVAMCRGMTHLDGVALPAARRPMIHWVLTKTRRQQVDSVQAEYLRWIGGHPHQIAWDNRAKHYIDSIWISTRWCLHGHDAHCHHCSRIVFHCEQSGLESALGGRIDSCHADEPPSWRIWREIRSRKRAMSNLLLIITATPLYRKDWEDMAREFVDCDERPRDGRVEVRSTLHDNQFLTPDDRAKLIANWKGDPLFDARLDGTYVDASGLCPFPKAWLDRWEKRCAEPILTKRMMIEAERDTESGIVLEHRKASVDFWWMREKHETYWALIDPSTGIEDSTHDPAGVSIFARRRPRLVARYDGYLGAHGCGVLATKLARYYNNAYIDVETNGGYGRGSLQAIRALGYHYLNWQDVELSPGQWRKRLGWVTTPNIRGSMMVAIQRALEENDIHIPCRSVISTLRGVILGPGGKYVAAPGRHDEDMILLGRALLLMTDRPDAPVAPSERRLDMSTALRRETGRGRPTIDDDEPSDRPRIKTR